MVPAMTGYSMAPMPTVRNSSAGYWGDCLAGKAYMNICKRILGEEVPLLDLEAGNGFFKKIGGLFKKK